MQEQLTEIGLSKNESTIYLFLLKHPETTTGPIIKETDVANSRVYETLNTLITKGMATYTVQKDGKHFSAAAPNTLLEREAERKKKIAALVPELEKLQLETTSETTTAVYEGFDGFKTAFKKIIDDCPEKGVIKILSFSEQTYAERSLRIFLKNMNLKSNEKQQELKLIFDKSVKDTLGHDREIEPFTEVKYLPPGFASPVAIDIFDDYVYIFLWEEKPYVFMIKNARIAQSFTQYFDTLWKLAKK